MLVAAAAAVILAAGGIWYGLAAGPGRDGRPPGAVNAVTAVKGCPGLAATSGTLTRVAGPGLVLKTPGGTLVTVTAPAAAKVSRQVTGTLSDIRDGAQVIVNGTGSAAGIAARQILVGPLPRLHAPPHAPRRHGRPPRHGARRSPALGGRAAGTVTRLSQGGFTVNAHGVRIRITTSGSTTVYIQATSTVSQLRDGEFTIAVGHAKADGTLAAKIIEQGNLIPRFQHGGRTIRQSWLGCSPAAIATTAFLAAG